MRSSACAWPRTSATTNGSAPSRAQSVAAVRRRSRGCHGAPPIAPRMRPMDSPSARAVEDVSPPAPPGSARGSERRRPGRRAGSRGSRPPLLRAAGNVHVFAAEVQLRPREERRLACTRAAVSSMNRSASPARPLDSPSPATGATPRPARGSAPAPGAAAPMSRGSSRSGDSAGSFTPRIRGARLEPSPDGGEQLARPRAHRGPPMLHRVVEDAHEVIGPHILGRHVADERQDVKSEHRVPEREGLRARRPVW